MRNNITRRLSIPSRQVAATPWSTIPTHILLPTAPPSSHVRLYSTKGNPPPPPSSSSAPSPTEEPSTPSFPHLTSSETVHMTPISHKPSTPRLATALCRIIFSTPTPYTLLTTADGYTKKGDVLAVARVAGIMAAKNTADIVPLAHPGIGVTGVEVDVRVCAPTSTSTAASSEATTTSENGPESPPTPHGSVLVTSTVHCHGKTGVEMEALASALGAALTVYDMCKAVDKGMVIDGARVVKKRGGKSGGWDWGVPVDDGKGEEGK